MARHLSPRKAALPSIEWALTAISVVMVFFLMLVIGTLFGFALIATTARGQSHNHDQHHAQYENWQSNAGFGCCNNNDCGTLGPDRVRENGDHTEVLVLDPRGDQWCPVEFGHLVNQQNGKRPSPDWTLDHACIIGQNFAVTACERLKCFMEKGKF